MSRSFLQQSTRSFFSSSGLNRISSVFVDKQEITYPIAGKQPRVVQVKDAFNNIKTGDHLFVHGIAATCTPLLQGLCEYADANNVSKLTLHHLHLEGPTPWTEEKYNKRIRSNSLFTGHNLRPYVNNGIVDFNSCFLQEVPLLFRKKAIKLNAALIHVSPPDANGYCSLGTTVEIARAAVTNADHIIAMSNSKMPRTFGDGVIHCSHIDVMVDCDGFPLYERKIGTQNEQEKKIGKIIAENLVDNGATLQMGIGAVPDAALYALTNHKDLGIHTEMFSDGVLDLVANNNITNSKKAIHPGKLVVSFVYGSTRLYNFLHDNPLIEFGDVQWVNDPAIIRKNPKLFLIPSEDDSSPASEARPIIALPSIAKKTGVSKIVPYIKEGAGVVTTRSHVHYVVTEHGIAQLWGKNMRQRAYELIKIADPSVRESLEKAAFDRLKVMPSAD
ncbi:hypothetical protein WR25_04071 [Diploscapter pachys]|uniref:Uncharacterized protein n=1 Tax=Diploscapter pachys TaxID=2018661 RepID=A0A2A2J5V8_9BILA|nr:hypothetical protein WR25_04071 [Diploscapter pachys]